MFLGDDLQFVFLCFWMISNFLFFLIDGVFWVMFDARMRVKSEFVLRFVTWPIIFEG